VVSLAGSTSLLLSQNIETHGRALRDTEDLMRLSQSGVISTGKINGPLLPPKGLIDAAPAGQPVPTTSPCDAAQRAAYEQCEQEWKDNWYENLGRRERIRKAVLSACSSFGD
jgi:hypothetical protein